MNWSEVELHDLMEARFDTFADTLQWRMYGVTVPRFGDPSYNSGYYGTMFDWGGLAGRRHVPSSGLGDRRGGDPRSRGRHALRHVAEEGPADPADDDPRDRPRVESASHVAAHLLSPNSASTSFMNYPWGFTGWRRRRNRILDELRMGLRRRRAEDGCGTPIAPTSSSAVATDREQPEQVPLAGDQRRRSAGQR